MPDQLSTKLLAPFDSRRGFFDWVLRNRYLICVNFLCQVGSPEPDLLEEKHDHKRHRPNDGRYQEEIADANLQAVANGVHKGVEQLLPLRAGLVEEEGILNLT